MASPDLGNKHDCPNCQSRFFDLGKSPAICPKCGTDDAEDSEAESLVPDAGEELAEAVILDQTGDQAGDQTGNNQSAAEDGDDDDPEDDLDDDENDGFLMEDTSDLEADDDIPGKPSPSGQNNDEDI